MPPLMNLLEDFSRNVYMICINCKVILVHNPSTNYTLRKLNVKSACFFLYNSTYVNIIISTQCYCCT